VWPKNREKEGNINLEARKRSGDSHGEGTTGKMAARTGKNRRPLTEIASLFFSSFSLLNPFSLS
jgi:hypothetical protein